MRFPSFQTISALTYPCQPHRRGHAFDVVVVDSGESIRATLARNPDLRQPQTYEQLALVCSTLDKSNLVCKNILLLVRRGQWIGRK